jgi:hypothetical protein
MLPADDEIKLIAEESVMWIANEVNQESSYCGTERDACALVDALQHEHPTCPYLRCEDCSVLRCSSFAASCGVLGMGSAHRSKKGSEFFK